MKPQKALTASLATMLFTAFMLIPLNSSETVSKNQKKSSTNLKKVIAEGTSKMDNKIDFTVPVTPTKNQEKQNEGKNNNHENNDLSKVRHHGEEEKHKNHLYHYNRIKTKRKCHNIIICLFIRIIIAVSYFSVLLCGYMNICH